MVKKEFDFNGQAQATDDVFTPKLACTVCMFGKLSQATGMVYGHNGYIIMLLPLQVIQISPPSSSHSPPPEEHQREAEVHATSDLCGQLLLRQKHLEKFLEQQLIEVHVKLNEHLTLLPAQRSVTTLSDTAPPLDIHAHTLPPFDEDVLDKTFDLPRASTPVTSAARPQPEQASAVQYDMPMSRLLNIRSSSCSRENFTANLNKELFSVEERLQSNIKGVLQKKKLDVKKVSYVQEQAFEFFPLTAAENKQQCWARCVRAIDSCNRQLVRGMKKSTSLLEKYNV